MVKDVDPWADAIIAMAGWVTDVGHGARHDIEATKVLVGAENIGVAADLARRLLRPHQDAIVAVTNELFVSGALTGERIVEIVGPATGRAELGYVITEAERIIAEAEGGMG